ncbi:hypothetical protein VTI28DRAFT_9423 [Corynascus sepedonium]
MQVLNNAKDTSFEPTVFNTIDLDRLMSRVPELVNEWLLQPYVRLARRIIRVETDVMILTHLIMYFTTSVVSAAWLFFYQFTWVHGLLHFVMQVSYMSMYTLMMHQHIHQRGILAKHFALVDTSSLHHGPSDGPYLELILLPPRQTPRQAPPCGGERTR